MSAYLQTWIVARVVCSVAAVSMVLLGLRTSRRIQQSWHLNAASEGQLALEKRAELAAVAVAAGLVAIVVALIITLFGADRQAHVISGAMCAYGVFASTASGFVSLAFAFAAAVACTLWLVVHRLDLRLEKAVLTAVKFRGLYLVAPLVILDAVFFVRFTGELDLSANATCCSATLGAVSEQARGAAGGNPEWTFVAFLALALVSAALLLLASRRRVRWVYPGALAGMGALALGLVATLLYIAPHVYETPHHTCPFCLLHGHYAPYGWGLFVAFFVATTSTLGAALVTFLSRKTRETSTAHALARTVARRGAIAWLCVGVLALAPVVRYAWLTGSSLF